MREMLELLYAHPDGPGGLTLERSGAMWDRVKTVRLSEYGDAIVEWHATSDIEEISRAMFANYPNAVLEIKLV